jgi:(1->4)-alpha-D-glucan 1-alpha-D-glucosylmutase
MVGRVVSGMNSFTPIPLATYRLQFNRAFTFRQAKELVPYLAALGVTHCYASPYLRARPGSLHGYDIIDHTTLNPEIGTPEDYEGFVEALHQHGMGQILDIVPNHMGVMGSDNAWWLDVLENGQASLYADFFDIDWDPIKDELRGKILIPILEDQYGKVLESGALKLFFDCEHGEFSIFYYESRFPIAPVSYSGLLTAHLDTLQDKLGREHEDVLELQSVATAFSNLPGRQDTSPERRVERNREKEVQKKRLAALCARSPEIRAFLEERAHSLNGTVGDPSSFDGLHEVIKSQAFRLAQWRVAADDINYRRFFDVNDLAALRQENEAVFASTHRFVSELYRQGKVNGLRIDHPDGLYDPAKYFRELQTALGSNGHSGGKSHPAYILVEKILTGNERLRKSWPVSGTTGYEFANLVNGLFVDNSAETKLERIYRGFIGDTLELRDLVHDCKKLILKASLASELNVLATLLSRIALADRHTCDFTLNSLRSALAETIACFPVYRTYIADDRVSVEDRRYIELAIVSARRRSNTSDLSIFDFIRDVLLLTRPGTEPYRQRLLRFAMKFQQVTSAVMAKGLEDTAFYRYQRLISLNEVGGDPGRFGVSVEEFHRTNVERAQCWPGSMLSTSTHDSKRSEDVRARIDVLSEVPGLWRLTLRHWRDWNRSKKRLVDGLPAPSRNDEYLFYQTLVGTWPIEPADAAGWKNYGERIEQYMLKATREAKLHTSWANPQSEYEEATTNFVRAVLKEGKRNRFLNDMSEFQRRILRFGLLNSLSQTVLKLTSPGVPDIYQGMELWDLSLVDPDNRRPVDYAKRSELLNWVKKDEAKEGFLPELLDKMPDGRIKLFVTTRTLRARRDHAPLFGSGSYAPAQVSGAKAQFLCAFLREKDSQLALVVVPRLCATLLGTGEPLPLGEAVWADTTIELPTSLHARTFTDAYSGQHFGVQTDGNSLLVSSVLSRFPLGLLLAD